MGHIYIAAENRVVAGPESLMRPGRTHATALVASNHVLHMRLHIWLMLPACRLCWRRCCTTAACASGSLSASISR